MPDEDLDHEGELACSVVVGFVDTGGVMFSEGQLLTLCAAFGVFCGVGIVVAGQTGGWVIAASLFVVLAAGGVLSRRERRS